MLRAIVILPGTVLGLVPAVILWLTRDTAHAWELAGPDGARFWLALALAAAGVTIMARTIALFAHIGEGTLAPWQPTAKLVVAGIYRHLRNPMISGVVAVLLGEVVLFASLPLLGWAAVFAAANAIYIPLSEEPGLERRFGDDYRRYKANVPRWLPRLTPWKGIDEA